MARDRDENDLLRDDPELREAFRRGERGAMERVYESYFEQVRGVCVHGFSGFRGFVEPADRDDAVQLVFAAAFEERARLAYNGVDPYRRYVLGITRNTIREMLKKQKRFERRPEVAEATPPNAEEALIARETALALRGFRESLEDARERAVLDGYFVDGLSEERLAARLGITRYRTRKAIGALGKRLRRLLRDHGVDDV